MSVEGSQPIMHIPGGLKRGFWEITHLRSLPGHNVTDCDEIPPPRGSSEKAVTSKRHEDEMKNVLDKGRDLAPMQSCFLCSKRLVSPWLVLFWKMKSR